MGRVIEWTNPYQHTVIPEGNVSLANHKTKSLVNEVNRKAKPSVSEANILDGIATAVREDIAPLWPGENGRADQEMILAARRSIQANRQPIALPLPPDPFEEEAFDRNFEQQFGVHPREDLEKVLSVNFKAR